ncbi:MAG: sigma-70 family RNA polymerase sigma factor [Planctomycetales bacterium]|nr:sigma-70 family RNA polymerase sigma factor [Planctomycetales bacterium]
MSTPFHQELSSTESALKVLREVAQLKHRFDISCGLERREANDWHIRQFEEQGLYAIPPQSIEVEELAARCLIRLPKEMSHLRPTHLIRMKQAASAPSLALLTPQAEDGFSYNGRRVELTLLDQSARHDDPICQRLAAATNESTCQQYGAFHYLLSPAGDNPPHYRVDVVAEGARAEMLRGDRSQIELSDGIAPYRRLFVDFKECCGSNGAVRHHVRGLPLLKSASGENLAPEGFVWWGASVVLPLSKNFQTFEIEPLLYSSFYLAPADMREEIVAQTDFDMLPIVWDESTKSWSVDVDSSTLSNDALAMLFAPARATQDYEPSLDAAENESPQWEVRHRAAVSPEEQLARDARMARLRELSGATTNDDIVSCLYGFLLQGAGYATKNWRDAEPAAAHVIEKTIRGYADGDYRFCETDGLRQFLLSEYYQATARLDALRALAHADDDETLFDRLYRESLKWNGAKHEPWEDNDPSIGQAIDYVMVRVAQGMVITDYDHLLRYLTRKVKNLRTDEYRKQGAYDRRVKNAPEPTTKEPWFDFEAREVRELLLDRLREAPLSSRLVIVFHDLEGFTFTEIGEIMKKKPDAARQQRNRAVERLGISDY